MAMHKSCAKYMTDQDVTFCFRWAINMLFLGVCSLTYEKMICDIIVNFLNRFGIKLSKVSAHGISFKDFKASGCL